jgi:hypothetical protein
VGSGGKAPLDGLPDVVERLFGDAGPAGGRSSEEVEGGGDR